MFKKLSNLFKSRKIPDNTAAQNETIDRSFNLSISDLDQEFRDAGGYQYHAHKHIVENNVAPSQEINNEADRLNRELMDEISKELERRNKRA